MASSGSRESRLLGLLPWLILAAALGLTYELWRGEERTASREVESAFDYRVREAASRVEQRMQAYEQVLRGAAGLFPAAGHVSRSDFRAYVRALGLEDHYPGIQAVGYSCAVPAGERERHVAGARNEGFPDYAIRPEGQRELYAPVVYIEPFSGRNLRAFGYDLMSEPERRAAAERARDGARAALTSRVRLQQEGSGESQAGVILLLPVYRRGAAPPDLATRREEIAGWVFGTFRMDDLMSGVFGERTPEIGVDVYEGEETSAETLMHRDEAGSPVPPAAPGRRAVRRLVVAGRTWTLAIRSLPPFEANFSRGRPQLVALAGAGGSLLLALLTGTLVRGRQKALEAADEIRKTEERYRQIVETAHEGIWLVDAPDRTTFVNRRMAEMLGYGPEEMLGKSPSAFMTEEARREAEPELDRTRHGASGIHERRYLRKDGSEIWALLSVSPFHSADGAYSGALAMVSDITKRKRAEEEIGRLNSELESRVGERTARLAEANEELEAYSYSVAHELRTPLRAIDGFSARIARDYEGLLDDEGRRLFSHVRWNAQRMGQLIDDLLTFSRAGRADLAFAAVDMTGVARAAFARVVPDPLSRARIAFSVGDLPEAYGDVALLGWAWENLLSNAVKFSAMRERPEIRVEGSVEGDEVSYRVRDNGIGFDVRYVDKLFGVFNRLHGATEFEGTGVGLALVRRIVLRHGGRVWAEGELDRGAAFAFALPAIRRPDAKGPS